MLEKIIGKLIAYLIGLCIAGIFLYGFIRIASAIIGVF